jgi:Ca2+-binding RTX toxin-like protein
VDLLAKADRGIVGETAVNPVAHPGYGNDPVQSGLGGIEFAGGNGNDILGGGAAGDRIYGNDGYNWIEGYAGDDLLFGGNAMDVLLGGDGRDLLYGNEGVNWIEGNAGADNLYGGNVQDTLLAGTENDNVYGNGGDDLIVGGSGSDRLYGAGGADVIWGDDANGMSFAPPAKPVLEVPVSQSVVTASSLTLPTGVVNVTATGRASVTLIGNDLDNTMVGNAGKNTIQAVGGNDHVNGGNGNDRLFGGGGNDSFAFTTRLGNPSTDRKVNFDSIGDFSVRDDRLELDNAIFKKLGKVGRLKKDYFTLGDKAKDANDFILYDRKTGVISYDAEGSGTGSQKVSART